MRIRVLFLILVFSSSVVFSQNIFNEETSKPKIEKPSSIEVKESSSTTPNFVLR